MYHGKQCISFSQSDGKQCFLFLGKRWFTNNNNFYILRGYYAAGTTPNSLHTVSYSNLTAVMKAIIIPILQMRDWGSEKENKWMKELTIIRSRKVVFRIALPLVSLKPTPRKVSVPTTKSGVTEQDSLYTCPISSICAVNHPFLLYKLSLLSF